MPKLVGNRCLSSWPKWQHDGRARPTSLGSAGSPPTRTGHRFGKNPRHRYLEFVKAGEHRVAEEEVHEP
jgi:hypothetical protein